MNRVRTSVIFIMCAAVCTSATADVYKCKQPDGSTAFQDRPCDGKAAGSAIDVRPAAGASDAIESKQSETSTNKSKALLDQYDRERQLRSLNFDIDKLEREIAADVRRMDEELGALKRKKQYANNNFAGATWEASISQEMQVVVDRYEAKAASDRARLDELRRQRSNLK